MAVSLSFKVQVVMNNPFIPPSQGEEAILRERAVNYLNLIKSICDSYPDGFVHGIQKDAIQNAWDARLKKSKEFTSKNWGVEFELLERDNPADNLLIITDHGTCGLTGNMTAQDIKDDEKLAQDERWARWEALAWNKESAEDLGSRGQGKMILINGSQDYELWYDSLRFDSTYRMGGTKASTTACKVFHKEGDEGRNLIKSVLDIEPLNVVGTRLIIKNPKLDFVEKLKSGEFLTDIEETWWPNIMQFGANIEIKHEGNIQKAGIPEIFPIDQLAQKKPNVKTWLKDNIKIKFNRKEYKIKRLYMACFDGDLSEERHVGVAVFRGGMKITTIPFPDITLQKRVYGSLELDDDLDEIMRGIELPSHYGFKNEGIWRKIQEAVHEEMRVFGHTKLGVGVDATEIENTKRNSAEKKAMHILSKLTKNWPFPNRGTGSTRPDDDDVTHVIHKDVACMLRNFIFPDATIPRLDYGQKVEDFFVTVLNKRKNEISGKLSVEVMAGDEVIMHLIKDRDIVLEPNQRVDSEKLILSAEEAVFENPGMYLLVIRLVDLEGNRLDQIRRRFWVADEPELSGPFKVRPIQFSTLDNMPSINNKMEWFLEPEGDGVYTFYYNLEHPAYLNSEENEMRRQRYLAEIFVMGALQLLISSIDTDREQAENESNNLPFEVQNLVGGDAKVAYLELAKAISSLKAEIFNAI